MSATTTERTTTTTKPRKGTAKRECGTCARKLCRVFDRETRATEYLCVFCVCFVPTNPNRK